jgi:thermitase
MFYHIGLLGIQLCALWGYFGKKPGAKSFVWIATLMSTMVYVFGLFQDTITWTDRLWFTSRDFLVVGISAGLFFFSLKWHQFVVPVLFLLALATSMLHYFLPGKYTLKSLQLEEKSEILLLTQLGKFNSLHVLDVPEVKNIEPAFYPANQASTELDEYFKVDVSVQTYSQWRRLLHKLRTIKGVIYLEPNVFLSLNLPHVTSSKILDNQSLTRDPLSGEQWALRQLDLKGLNELLAGNRISTVRKGLLAILDTGIDQQHEDLSGHYQSMSSVTDRDPKGHGTHCAGIASAVTGNNKGIASLNFESGLFKVTGIRVLNAAGYGTKETIVDGIIEAVDKGASVISLSLGGPGNPSHQRVYRKAVQYAAAKNTVIVVAAGNSNRNAKEFSPANVKGVITVAAVDPLLEKASFSNKVTDIQMAVSAPGVNILSTLPHNQYGHLSGTSMATPYVASLVALMKGIHPNLKTKDIFEILNQTGMETKNTRGTGKLIQPKRAIERIIK